MDKVPKVPENGEGGGGQKVMMVGVSKVDTCQGRRSVLLTKCLRIGKAAVRRCLMMVGWGEVEMCQREKNMSENGQGGGQKVMNVGVSKLEMHQREKKVFTMDQMSEKE